MLLNLKPKSCGQSSTKKTKKKEKQMGDNKEFEVKAQTRKQGGNGTIQQMATESRSEQKKQKKIKK